MQFPSLSEPDRISRLQPPPRNVRMILDTDTYNEIDDQFAVAYALLSELRVEGIYAAPFLNQRSSSPADGMEKSYEEILRVLERLGTDPEGLVFKGATDYLPAPHQPVDSPAARHLIERALASPPDDPLYVVGIAAITNIASAILLEPEIIKHIVVVWLAGQPLHWPHVHEFNLGQDTDASRVLFNCGVPLVLIPCESVTTLLRTSLYELNACLRGKSAVGDFLIGRYEEYFDDHFGVTKEIWDIVTIAYLLDAGWVPTNLVHSPILTKQVTWSVDQSRHFIRIAYKVHRDPIFQDLFRKLADA